MTDQKPHVIKKSISLSAVVAAWADELADAKGFGTNFSAYIADLIRRDRERENDLQLARTGKLEKTTYTNAAREIVGVVDEAARKRKPKPRS